MIPVPKLSEIEFKVELLYFIQNPFGQLGDIHCQQNNF